MNARRRLFRRNAAMDILSWNRSLTQELARHDDHRLLDIGVVRAEDGSLWLAADPSRPAIPERALASRVAGVARSILREIRDTLASARAGRPAVGHS
jgi:hypothetical protein